MYKILISILTTVAVAVAVPNPLDRVENCRIHLFLPCLQAWWTDTSTSASTSCSTVIVEAEVTSDTISLPTTTSVTPRDTSTPVVTAASAFIARTAVMTVAPLVNPTTLQTVTRPKLETRGGGRFISDYDGHIITIRPCIPATTLDYHGTKPLITLVGNRCPGCDRVNDPNDNTNWNGRYEGGHRGAYDPDDDNLYWGGRDHGHFHYGPGDDGREAPQCAA